MLTLQAAVRVSLVLWTAKTDAIYAHLMECFGKGWADGLEATALAGGGVLGERVNEEGPVARPGF